MTAHHQALILSQRVSVPYYADDLDDLYEMIYNWGLFYAMGGGEKILNLTLQHWNAVTRFGDNGLVHPGDAEWHHAGEDGQAPNYDSEHKLLRSPFQTSQGPWLEASVEKTNAYLFRPGELGGRGQRLPLRHRPCGQGGMGGIPAVPTDGRAATPLGGRIAKVLMPFSRRTKPTSPAVLPYGGSSFCNCVVPQPVRSQGPAATV